MEFVLDAHVRWSGLGFISHQSTLPSHRAWAVCDLRVREELFAKVVTRLVEAPKAPHAQPASKEENGTANDGGDNDEGAHKWPVAVLAVRVEELDK